MAYNAKADAIKKLRNKKMSLDQFITPDEILEGTEDLGEDADLLKKETDLAPSRKDKGLNVEMHDGEVELETEDNPEEEKAEQDMVPTRDKQKQIAAQGLGHDQGDALSEEEILNAMYQEGDEKKKGFMGKAAMMMKNKLKR